ncbi:hypothetical protein ACF0H5_010229 [Mactra antiquata]
MALLRLKLFLSTLCILCMVNLVDCKKVKKLQIELNKLKEEVSALEDTIDQNRDELDEMEEKCSSTQECCAEISELRKMIEGPGLKCAVNGKTLGNSCYLFSSTSSTWQDAVKSCSDMGGRLAEVYSKEVNDFLTNMRKAANVNDIWLGASDIETEGTFKWETSKKEIDINSFTNWSPNQPDNWYTEDCLHSFGDSGSWNDIKCTSSYRYICEFTM